jgi:hypothetical protein
LVEVAFSIRKVSRYLIKDCSAKYTSNVLNSTVRKQPYFLNGPRTLVGASLEKIQRWQISI